MSLGILIAVVTANARIGQGPANGDDCGKGVACFPCLGSTTALHTTELAPQTLGMLNCSNQTQIHVGSCQSNKKGLIATKSVQSAGECCAACTANADCVSFTYWDQTQCHLFQSVGQLSPGSDCVTGAASAIPGPTPNPPAPVPPPGPVCSDCPNIVLMFTDDQDLTLGGWGDDVMTKTKQVLQGGGVFAVNWTIHTPICAPSRAELLSGRYFQNIQNAAKSPPQTLCGSGAVGHVDLQEKVYPHTFVQELRLQKGYATGLFGKCMNGGCKNPTAMNGAFDRWFEGTDYQNGTFYDNESPGNTFHAAGYAGGYLTSVIGNKTIDWIKNITATNPSRPFFVYFAPHAPHSPATPAAWYANACPNAASPRNPAYNYSSPLFHNLVARQPPLSLSDAETIDELARKRCQTLLSVDDSYTEIVSALEDMNLHHKTYYLVSSDHGYNLGQHRLPSNKFLLYDHSLRIPMLFMGPGIPQGATIGYRGTNVDVGPTIIGLAGGVVPDGMDGQNIAPLLVTSPELAMSATRAALQNATSPPPRPASYHLYYNQGPWEVGTPHALDDWSNTYIGLSGEFPGYGTLKYAEYDPYGKQSNFSSVYLYELFNLDTDPFELNNIYASAPAQLKSTLHAEVRRFFECAGAAQCG